MRRFVLGRIASALVLLLVCSFIVFSFMHLAPGSPEAVLLGGGSVTPEQVAQIRAEYHLDDPFLVQYASWLGGFVRGDLGRSIANQAEVKDVIAPKIVPSLELAAYAGLLILIFGVGGGILAAVKRGSAMDALASGGMLVGSSIAPYISGIVLIVVFGSTLGWFPVFGLGEGFVDRIYHLTLPAIALALFLAAFMGRITRASMIDALETEYVETARSRGLDSRSVVLKHGMRSALVPIVTVGGLTAGYLITGAVLVEYTFGLNGLGGQLVSAIEAKDFAVVQAIALLFTVLFILVNLVVDLLYPVIDPRVRLGVARRS
jgi:peptide/nickel transport system permease protein